MAKLKKKITFDGDPSIAKPTKKKSFTITEAVKKSGYEAQIGDRKFVILSAIYGETVRSGRRVLGVTRSHECFIDNDNQGETFNGLSVIEIKILHTAKVIFLNMEQAVENRKALAKINYNKTFQRPKKK